MKALLEIIGNNNLISSFDKNDIETFKQIATKLYRKARQNQDKKEYLLSQCLKFSNNETINIESAINEYLEVKCQEKGLKARSDIQMSSKFINEKDPLKRFDIKESAYQNAYKACIAGGL